MQGVTAAKGEVCDASSVVILRKHFAECRRYDRVYTWVRVFEIDVFGQPPGADVATRVGGYGRCGVAGRLEDRPRLVGDVTASRRPRRRAQVAGVARPAAGGLRRRDGPAARAGRVLGARTGARRGGSGPPAEHRPAAGRQVGRAVDGRHVGAGRRHELDALVAAAEQLVAAGAVLVARDAGRRAAVTNARRAAPVAGALCRRVAWVVRARTQRALRPTVTPSHAPTR